MLKDIFLFVSLLAVLHNYGQNRFNQLDSNGKKTGSWMKEYSNGNTRYTGQFLNDREVGVFKFYSEFYSNHPLIVKTYKKGTSNCKVEFYTSTGDMESQGELTGKIRTGNWLYYDTVTKNVILEENYVNGALSGEKRIFYPDGVLTEVSHYHKGKLHGESLRYTDRGKLIAKVPYQNGLIHGKIFYYHNTGVIRETGFYEDGKRVGRWEFYIEGVLAGFEEPNKKVIKKPVSLEQIKSRKKSKRK